MDDLRVIGYVRMPILGNERDWRRKCPVEDWIDVSSHLRLAFSIDLGRGPTTMGLYESVVVWRNNRWGDLPDYSGNLWVFLENKAFDLETEMPTLLYLIAGFVAVVLWAIWCLYDL